jgi:hypothetical protein
MAKKTTVSSESYRHRVLRFMSRIGILRNPQETHYVRQIEIAKAIKEIYDYEERENECVIHTFNTYFHDTVDAAPRVG